MLNFVKCYVGFLMLKESDIDTLENVKVGDRKRLITCQADLHKAEWSRSSLPSIDHAHRRAGLLLDTLSSTTMVANMSQHARFMRTNAAYLRSQLREHGARLLSAGSDAVLPCQLLDQVQAAARHTAALQQELGQLQRELGSFDITATRRPVNSVQMKDVSSHKFVKIVSIPIVALAAGAGCSYLWHSLK